MATGKRRFESLSPEALKSGPSLKTLWHSQELEECSVELRRLVAPVRLSACS